MKGHVSRGLRVAGWPLIRVVSDRKPHLHGSQRTRGGIGRKRPVDALPTISGHHSCCGKTHLCDLRTKPVRIGIQIRSSPDGGDRDEGSQPGIEPSARGSRRTLLDTLRRGYDRPIRGGVGEAERRGIPTTIRPASVSAFLARHDRRRSRGSEVGGHGAGARLGCCAARGSRTRRPTPEGRRKPNRGVCLPIRGSAGVSITSHRDHSATCRHPRRSRRRSSGRSLGCTQ